MIIRCPNCSTTYKVDGSVLDAPKPSFRCSRCKHVFTVHVRLQLDEEAPDAAPEATSDAADVVPDPGAPDPSGDTADGDLEADAGLQPREADASPVAQQEGSGEEPGVVDDDVVEEAGVEDVENVAETSPAPDVDPPARTLEEDIEEIGTDDTSSTQSRAPLPGVRHRSRGGPSDRTNSRSSHSSARAARKPRMRGPTTARGRTSKSTTIS